MNEQDKTSSKTSATPEADKKKQPVAGAAVESRPVAATKDAGADAAPAKPVIESTLVGKPDPGSKAAAKRSEAKPTPATKPASVEKPAPAEKAAATPVPPVPRNEGKPEATPFAQTPRPTETRAEPRTVVTRVEVRKGGFLPMVMGGVVAAGLGAAATYWAIPHLPQSLRPAAVEAVSADAQLDAARSAATDAARAEVQGQTDALIKRATEAGTDAARQALANVAPAEGSAAIPAEVTDKLTGLEKTVADLTARLSQQPTSGAAPMPVAGPSQAALDELATRLTQQQARIDELAARPTVDPATAQQVETLATQAQELQKTTEAANRRALAVTAASALQGAIESGTSRDQALADLSAAGVEVPALLTGDVPRLDQLRAEFAPAARAGLRAASKADVANEGAMGRVAGFLRVQTGARSVEPREGSDPDAILSRADAAVDAGDVQGALTEIAALPQAGQQAMSKWTDRAKAWVDANAALAALASASR